MTPIRLTPAQLKQINQNRAAQGAAPEGKPPAATTASRPGPSSGPTAAGGKPLWRCHTPGCGQETTALAAAQRHADNTGHRRFDWIPEGAPC